MTLILIFWKFGATLAIGGTLAAVALFGTGPLEGNSSPGGETAGQSVEFVIDPGDPIRARYPMPALSMVVGDEE